MNDAVAADEEPCRIDVGSLRELSAIWREAGSELAWTCPFVLPAWLDAWLKVFGRDVEPLILVARQGETVVGVAPLMIDAKTVRFLGDPEVCDYFDWAVAPGGERLFYAALAGYLSASGVSQLELGPMRPDASMLKFFSASRPAQTSELRVVAENVLVELDLPGTWDDFLRALDGKQRHELRRKLRRLDEAGRTRFRMVDGGAELPQAVDTFLRLFVMNRADKAVFMTGRMASFFRELSFALAEEGLLRLFFLDVDDQPVASLFCFDLQGTRYLYNNGYDAAYRGISVGIVSKVLSIKAAIDRGLRAYNLLKGSEIYKYRLGGKEAQLSRCLVTLS